MRRFDATPRRATPKGDNLHHLHSTASRRTTYPHIPLSALMAHDRPSTVDSHRFALPRTRTAWRRPSGEKLANDHRAAAWATGLGPLTGRGRRPRCRAGRPAGL